MKNKKNLSRRSFLQAVTGILVVGVPSFLGCSPSGGGTTDSDANDAFGRGRGGVTDSDANDASGRGRGRR